MIMFCCFVVVCFLKMTWDSPGSLVVKTPSFHSTAECMDPSLGKKKKYYFREYFEDWVIFIPCGLSTQHNSVNIYWAITVSRYIAKGNIGPLYSSSIMPSALTDLLIFFSFFKKNCTVIKGSSGKHPLVWERQERKQKEQVICPSWNVGIMNSEMPVY